MTEAEEDSTHPISTLEAVPFGLFFLRFSELILRRGWLYALKFRLQNLRIKEAYDLC